MSGQEEQIRVVLNLFFIKALEAGSFELFARSVAILLKIRDKCHRLVLTESLKKLYREKLRELERRPWGPMEQGYLKLIKSLLVDSAKVSEVADVRLPPHVEGELSSDDKPMARAAIAGATGAKCILVTKDKKDFIENPKISEYLAKRGIKVLLPEEAEKEL